MTAELMGRSQAEVNANTILTPAPQRSPSVVITPAWWPPHFHFCVYWGVWCWQADAIILPLPWLISQLRAASGPNGGRAGLRSMGNKCKAVIMRNGQQSKLKVKVWVCLCDTGWTGVTWESCVRGWSQTLVVLWLVQVTATQARIWTHLLLKVTLDLRKLSVAVCVRSRARAYDPKCLNLRTDSVPDPKSLALLFAQLFPQGFDCKQVHF